MTCFRYSPFYIWINTISCSFSKINIMTNNVLDGIISERIEEKYAVLKEWRNLPSVADKQKLPVYQDKPKWPNGYFGLSFFMAYCCAIGQLCFQIHINALFIPLPRLSKLCPDNLYFFTQLGERSLPYLCLQTNLYIKIHTRFFRLLYPARAPPCFDVPPNQHQSKGESTIRSDYTERQTALARQWAMSRIVGIMILALTVRHRAGRPS